MTKAWNAELKHFGQSYEETHVLDSAVLIMPLVFFMQAVGAFPSSPPTPSSDRWTLYLKTRFFEVAK